MDTAIVTGAETPLGLRIAQTLLRQGLRVHGIGNNFSKVTFADPQFKGHAVDLTDLDAVVSILGEILAAEQRLDVLIHAIDVTPGTALDKLSIGNLEAVLKIGLLGPVMMTRLALPNLLRFRGQLINVITANKHGFQPSAANALIEGGLREMNQALFDQSRDAGLRITNCLIRQNTELSDGTVGDATLAQAHINLADVARTIEQLLDPKAVNVPAEIVLHPRVSAGAEEALPQAPLPLDPYAAVVLPPKAYCPPEQPKIPTEKPQQIERTIPYTDEEMEDKIAAAIEEFEADPERYSQSAPPSGKAQVKQGDAQQENKQQQQGRRPQEGQKQNKRRRRRGGRNRNKNPQEGGAPESAENSVPDQGPEHKAQERADSSPQQKPPAQDAPQSRPQRRRKPAREKLPAVDTAPSNPAAKSDLAPKRPAAAKTPEDAEGSADSKPPAKKATKKAARKAAKKTVKKAAKKAAKKKVATKQAAKKRAVKKVPTDAG